MSWPAFPKRLQSAMKALCCLAETEGPMLSQEIARQVNVSDAETAKVLQLLVWGGFLASRRGSKGGFHLTSAARKITMGEVIDFFMARHPAEPEGDFAVMRALRKCTRPCEKAFGKLSLAEVIGRNKQKVLTQRRKRH